MGSRVHVFISFDGVWKKQGQTWVYNNGTTKALAIKKGVTYLELLDKLYDAFAVDRLLFDLKLEVLYICGSFAVPPTLLSRDGHVAIFLAEISTSLQHRVPLCVTPVQKNIVVDQSLSVSINKVVRGEDYFHPQVVTIVRETSNSKNDPSNEYDSHADDNHIDSDVDYYVETWRTSDADIIYPCGNEDYSIVPGEKNHVGCLKKKKLGKAKMKCLPSQGKQIVVGYKCSRCGGCGHNKASCNVRN